MNHQNKSLSARLGTLRELMHQEPSARGWSRVLKEVMECEDTEVHMLLHYICDHLRTERQSWAKVAQGLPAHWFAKTSRDEPRLSIWEALGDPEVKMRLIPPGSFIMGSPKNELGRYMGEKQHEEGRLELGGMDIPKVYRFKYLRCWVSEEEPIAEAIRGAAAKGERAAGGLRGVFFHQSRSRRRS